MSIKWIFLFFLSPLLVSCTIIQTAPPFDEAIKIGKPPANKRLAEDLDLSVTANYSSKFKQGPLVALFLQVKTTDAFNEAGYKLSPEGSIKLKLSYNQYVILNSGNFCTTGVQANAELTDNSMVTKKNFRHIKQWPFCYRGIGAKSAAKNNLEAMVNQVAAWLNEVVSAIAPAGAVPEIPKPLTAPASKPAKADG